MLSVRYGKAKRGQPPRRRNVASVMGWAVEAVADYAQNIRPRFGLPDHPALWVTERGGRVKPAEIDDRFAAYRRPWGCRRPWSCTVLRHAYVTHLTEDRVDRQFIQAQVGHENHSSTAVYTHVSSDFMNTALRRALAPAFSQSGRSAGSAARNEQTGDGPARLPVAPAAGHGGQGHVQHQRSAGTAAERGISLSSSQVYRLVAERPERLSLKILMALLDILGCTMKTSSSRCAAEASAPKAAAAAVSASCGRDVP